MVHGRCDAGLGGRANARVATARVAETFPDAIEPIRYSPDSVSMRIVEAADAPPASGVMAMTEAGSATGAIAASAAALRSSAITENTSATPLCYTAQ